MKNLHFFIQPNYSAKNPWPITHKIEYRLDVTENIGVYTFNVVFYLHARDQKDAIDQSREAMKVKFAKDKYKYQIKTTTCLIRVN